MSDRLATPCTAFRDTTRIATGPLLAVALTVKAAAEAAPSASILVFDDETGRVVDLDLRGTPADIEARLTPPKIGGQPGIGVAGGHAETRAPDGSTQAARGRGRPKLGVIAREVTLLPRHWDWLAQQSGGASNALRRLVEEARKNDGGRSRARKVQEATYAFISAMAGDREGFEEASRALFANDTGRFAEHSRSWPADIRDHAVRLMSGPAAS